MLLKSGQVWYGKDEIRIIHESPVGLIAFQRFNPAQVQQALDNHGTFVAYGVAFTSYLGFRLWIEDSEATLETP